MSNDNDTTDNPKTELTGNAVKDPADRTTGDDPMTGAQASYLKTLSEQANSPASYDEGISKAEASKRIDDLRAKIGLDEQGARRRRAWREAWAARTLRDQLAPAPARRLRSHGVIPAKAGTHGARHSRQASMP